MRFLHTADWHVGKTLRNRSRADEHRAVLKEIANIAREHRVDGVLVAGDLFDSTAPSPESEEIVYDALLDLASDGMQVVVIAGNHDHPKRLHAVAPLLRRVSVVTGATVQRADEGGVVTVETRLGERARIALLPFLSQKTALSADELMENEASDNVMAYQDVCRRIIGKLCRDFTHETVNILMAHLHVLGGTMGGGERAAHSVLEYYVNAQSFTNNLSYVALGHLHAPQTISGQCPIWYPGSPIQLDFGETEVKNCALIVDAHAGLPAEVTKVPLTSGRRLRTLTGTLSSLREFATQVGDDYLKLVLDEPPRIGLADEARDLFPNAVDVIVTQTAPNRRRDDDPRESIEPRALFGSYLKERNQEDPRLIAAFDELMERANATA